MGYTLDPKFIAWCDYWDAWNEWTHSEPSLKHPIKYLKWYFSEPKYENFIKEIAK